MVRVQARGTFDNRPSLEAQTELKVQEGMYFTTGLGQGS